ncbi:MAG: ATP-binding cassette domain-containing protein [Candidatus Caldarchaeum sp.]|nr:ATP-binding cassette domain-containing protein [Candidatus Caldarchaeum sp.]
MFSLISGLEKPDAGRVYLNGEDVTGMKPYHLSRKGLVRTFQIVRPFKSLTVYQNLLAPSTVRGNKLDQAYVDEVLNKLGLAEKKHVPTSLLTHGELKKLEVARGLAANPVLLLLDEPFGGLTVSEIEQVWAVLNGFTKNGGTLVIIEHRLRELMKIVERIVVMDQGRVIFEGLPAEVPKSEEVIRAYLGSPEVLKGG